MKAMVTMLALLADAPTGRWVHCEDGTPADLRPGTPTIVVAGDAPGDIGWSSLFTAFALYSDGKLFVRRGETIRRRTSSLSQTESLLRDLAFIELWALDELYDRTTPRQRQRRTAHSPVPETMIHLWRNGCRKTIRIVGLQQFGLDALAGTAGPMLIPREDLDEAKAVLASLPAPLPRVLVRMLRASRSSDARWCSLASCFADGKSLPYEESWTNAEGRP